MRINVFIFTADAQTSQNIAAATSESFTCWETSQVFQLAWNSDNNNASLYATKFSDAFKYLNTRNRCLFKYQSQDSVYMGEIGLVAR